jgi:hypothetical protein
VVFCLLIVNTRALLVRHLTIIFEKNIMVLLYIECRDPAIRPAQALQAPAPVPALPVIQATTVIPDVITTTTIITMMMVTMGTLYFFPICY